MARELAKRSTPEVRHPFNSSLRQPGRETTAIRGYERLKGEKGGDERTDRGGHVDVGLGIVERPGNWRAAPRLPTGLSTSSHR